ATAASDTASPPGSYSVYQHLTGLVIGQVYFLAVSAVNTSGAEGACSSVVNATARAEDTTPPAAPTSVTQVGSFTANPTNFTGTWQWPQVIDQPDQFPVPTYTFVAQYTDATGQVSGTTPPHGAATTTITLPYHSTGQAQPGTTCIRSRDLVGNLSAASTCAAWTSPALSGTLTASWTPPTTNTDGSVL